MYTPGCIIYFTPFYFPNGQSAPKPKYFIVINITENDMLLACLPTSKDHIPGNIVKKHGCINDDAINFNCYFFRKGQAVTTNLFAFPLDTYVYGQQVDFFDLQMMNSIYTNPSGNFQIMGTLNPQEFNDLKKCIKSSKSVKRKIKRSIN